MNIKPLFANGVHTCAISMTESCPFYYKLGKHKCFYCDRQIYESNDDDGVIVPAPDCPLKENVTRQVYK